MRGEPSGGRGSSSQRKDGDFPDFYNMKNKYDVVAREKAEAYLGVDNGGTNDQWEKSLSEEELKNFTLYTGDYYKQINEAMREKDENSDYWEVAQNLEKSLNRQTLSKNITLHRGDDGAIFGVEDMDSEDMYSTMKLLEGTKFSYNNFVSTSPVKPWQEKVQYHIKVPKGKAKGGYVEHFSEFSGERELLLSSKTRFRIDKVKRADHEINGGFVDVYMTVID